MALRQEEGDIVIALKEANINIIILSFIETNTEQLPHFKHKLTVQVEDNLIK